MSQIRFDLLRKLYEFVMLLPPEAFDLETVVRNEGTAIEPVASCGAICCAIGWCPAVPEIAALGVHWHGVGVVNAYHSSYFADVAQSAFNVDWRQAFDLFGKVGNSRYDADLPNASHRDLFGHRVRCFFDGYEETL